MPNASRKFWLNDLLKYVSFSFEYDQPVPINIENRISKLVRLIEVFKYNTYHISSGLYECRITDRFSGILYEKVK